MRLPRKKASSINLYKDDQITKISECLMHLKTNEIQLAAVDSLN